MESAEADAAAIRARVAELRSDVAEIQKVVDATLIAEEAVVALNKQKNNSVAATLGLMLKKKGREKMIKIVSTWGNEFGVIDKSEFAKQVTQLGLKAERAEMDQLYDSLDSNGNGSLEIDEMKRCVTTLQETADQQRAFIKELGRRSAEVAREARHLQSAWRKKREADEQREQYAREQEQRAETLRLMQERDAKLAMLARKEEKAAAAAAAKAAFDANVRAKRLSHE